MLYIMRLRFVSVLFLTVELNFGQDSGYNLDIPGSAMLQRSPNPRYRRSPHSYYGLLDYMFASPSAYYRPAAPVGANNGIGQGIQRQPQPPALGRGRGRTGRVSPHAFGRTFGMFNNLHHEGRDRSPRLGLDMGMGAVGLYGARTGSGWRSYGGSSSSKGSYYYRMPSSYSGSSYSYYNKGSYYRGKGMGKGKGTSYWS